MRSYVRSMAMATPTSRIASPTFHVPRLLTLNLTQGEGIDRGKVVLDGPRPKRRDRSREWTDRNGEEGEMRARRRTSSSTMYVRNRHLGGARSPDCVGLWTWGVEDGVASCGPSRESSTAFGVTCKWWIAITSTSKQTIHGVTEGNASMMKRDRERKKWRARWKGRTTGEAMEGKEENTELGR